jgi:hypothetical protein
MRNDDPFNAEPDDTLDLFLKAVGVYAIMFFILWLVWGC